MLKMATWAISGALVGVLLFGALSWLDINIDNPPGASANVTPATSVPMSLSRVEIDRYMASQSGLQKAPLSRLAASDFRRCNEAEVVTPFGPMPTYSQLDQCQVVRASHTFLEFASQWQALIHPQRISAAENALQELARRSWRSNGDDRASLKDAIAECMQIAAAQALHRHGAKFGPATSFCSPSHPGPLELLSDIYEFEDALRVTVPDSTDAP